MLELPKRPYQRLSPPHWGAPADHAFRARVRSGAWRDASKSRVLERVIARKLDVPPEWVLATSSCTSALGVAYERLRWGFDTDARSCDVAAGDRASNQVRVSPLTYPATYCWAINFGLDIKWVDVDDKGWPTGPVDVGVDLWGRAAPDPGIILDAAHRVLDGAHTEHLNSGPCRAVCYSFGPTKEIPCLEGGAIIAPFLADAAHRARAEALIHSGQGNPLGGGFKGYLSAPSAAAICAQIRVHDMQKQRRQNVLEEYHQWFGSALMTLPGEASGHLCVVKLKTPGHVLQAQTRLRRLYIDNSLHYPIPPEVPCPNAHALVKSLISLPCNTEMRRRDVLLVSRAVLTAV